MPTTTDDFTNPLLQAWDDVDRWLVDEARELARLDLALETTAYASGPPTQRWSRRSMCDRVNVGDAVADHVPRGRQRLVALPATHQDEHVAAQRGRLVDCAAVVSSPSGSLLGIGDHEEPTTADAGRAAER